MKSKTLLRTGILMLCLMMVLSMFASCGGSDDKDASKDTSKDTSKIEESSEVTSDDASDDAPGDASDDASADTSADASADESADASADESADASADESTDASTDASTDESEVIPDEYKDLAGIDALEKIEEKIEKDYNGKAAITLTFETEITADVLEAMTGQSMTGIAADGFIKMNIKSFVDVSGDVNKGQTIMDMSMKVEVAGQTIADETFSEDSLTIGDKTYVFDHDAKTYYLEKEEEDDSDFSFIASFFDGTIASHETKTETINGVDYVADWFTLEDGSTIGLLTLNGELAYIAASGEDLPVEMYFQFNISHDVTGANFEIPAGYTEVPAPVEEF